MIVKICGVVSLGEALDVFELGADLIGLLVDIPGTKLSLSAAVAAKIVSEVDGARCVLLTLEEDPRTLERLVRTVRPWGLQLLRAGAGLVESLRAVVDCRLIPVIHVQDERAIGMAGAFQAADMLLLDSRVGDQLGGTGRTHDWSISRKIIDASVAPVLLAGGLSASNVEHALKLVHPAGVDVESAMRNEYGFRDLSRIREFIGAVRSSLLRLATDPPRPR